MPEPASYPVHVLVDPSLYFVHVPSHSLQKCPLHSLRTLPWSHYHLWSTLPHPPPSFFIVPIVLAYLEPWAWSFLSLLLRIHTANNGSGLTLHLEKEEDCTLFLLICCCPILFEITSIPEICGVNWREHLREGDSWANWEPQAQVWLHTYFCD